MQLRKLIKLVVAMTLAVGVLRALGCKGQQAFAATDGGPRVVQISVTERGYEPSKIQVKKGEPLLLVITRKTDATCAREILIQGTDINVPLPLNKAVEVAWTPNKSGQIRYGCAMGMMVSGVLIVSE